ncbi:MAG: hypothetical protein JJ992_22830 [Planctomycetes bacterium]|nr:hypothetical protein [Planctomycetota bacterium]
MFGLFKDEGECVVEFLMGPEPDEFAQSGVDIGAEHIRVFGPDERIDPVCRDDQIIILAVILGALEFGFKPHVDAQLPGTFLQEDQHLFASNSGKAVAGRDRPDAIVFNRDVIPVGEVIADRLGALRVVRLHAAQRIVGQDDPPAEGIVGLVALEHYDLMGRVTQFHADREVETGRPPAQANYLHPVFPQQQASHGPVLTQTAYYFKLEVLSLNIESCLSDGGNQETSLGWRHEGGSDRPNAVVCLANTALSPEDSCHLLSL